MEEQGISVTKHANKRIRERVGVNKKTVDSLAEKALKDGLSHKELTGHLKKFVDGLFFHSKKANNIKIFSDKAYIFRNTVLITVIHLPHNLAKIALKLKRKKAIEGKNEKCNDAE